MIITAETPQLVAAPAEKITPLVRYDSEHQAYLLPAYMALFCAQALILHWRTRGKQPGDFRDHLRPGGPGTVFLKPSSAWGAIDGLDMIENASDHSDGSARDAIRALSTDLALAMFKHDPTDYAKNALCELMQSFPDLVTLPEFSSGELARVA